MTRISWIFTFSMFYIGWAQAQTIPLDPANTWIVPGQAYVRIVTEEEGVYRVAALDLQAAGFNLSSVNPDFLHLIYRGNEVPIHVIKAGNQMETFEFYSAIHDGADEWFMYRNLNGEIDPTAHPNPRMSQLSRESAFFLTWDNQPGLRYTRFADFNFGSFTSESCYRTTATSNFEDTLVQENGSNFAVLYNQNPLYVAGEGYAGPFFQDGAPANFVLESPHGCPSPDSTIFSIRAFANTMSSHNVTFSVNGTPLVNSQFGSYYSQEWSQSFSGTIPSQTTISATETSVGRNFVSFAELAYDRIFALDAESNQRIIAPPSAVPKYYHWQNAMANDSCWIFDVANGLRMSGTATPGTTGADLDIIVPADGATRNLYLVTDAGFRSPLRIEAARMEDYSHHVGVDFIIISDRILQSSAEDYADYRATAAPTQMSAEVFYMDAIYDEFGFGSSTPLAIKRFLMTVKQNWSNAPKFVLLWGKAKKDARNAIGNHVPTWGYPAFDLEFTTNFNASPIEYLPDLPIGRIPVQNNFQGQAYLSKVQAYEAYSFEPWMLKAAFFAHNAPSTGSLGEVQAQADLDTFLANVPSGTAYLYVTDTGVVHTTSPLTSTQAIDQGVAWIDFKEFTGNNSLAYNCDLKDPSFYNNHGRFPFITGTGVQPAGCLADSLLLAERWVLEPNKGAIGFFAPGNTYFAGPWFSFMTSFLSSAYGNHTGRTIGEIVDSTYILRLNGAPGRSAATNGFLLLGDPSLVIVNPFTTSITDSLGPQLAFFVYPNPFVETVHFDFQLATRQAVSLEVVDVAGRSLYAYDAGIRSPGTHQLVWTPGVNLPPGIYLSKLKIGTTVLTRKLMHAP